MRILITGCEGLLGANLCYLYSKNHEVIGTDKYIPTLPYTKNIKMDITVGDEVRIIEKIKPQLVVHCAALVNVDYCEENPQEAEVVNSIGTRNVATAAERAGSFLLHISTDAVFDGVEGNYHEESPPNPINVYGRTKWAAEREVLARGGTVIRTNIYGWNRQNKQSLAEWMIATLEKREILRAFRDVYFTPTLVNNLAPALLELYKIKYKGIIHLAGSEFCSKLEFAYALAEIFQLDKTLIQPCGLEDAKLIAPRGKNLTLSTAKARKILSTKMLGLKAGLRLMKDLRERGYIDGLRKK